jgi:tRNA-dihydrouridine synthase A
MPNNPAETPESPKPAKIGVSDDFPAEKLDRLVSVAPMMDWTDRHCRYFLRGFSPRVLLYSEMISAASLVHGDRARLLRHAREEHPLALQLGGCDPVQLAAAARFGVESGYEEINLNCGCPSDRVQAAAFGACLMLEPERVAAAVQALRAAVDVPVTVKMRIGVLAGGLRARLQNFEERDYAALQHFTATVSAAGCRHFIVHARQAVLGGLSPRQNREVPPLRLDVVRRLKRDFPHLWIGVNGGLRDAAQCRAALEWADGVMLGREAYHRPQVLAELHAALWQDGWRAPEAAAMLERMALYAEREVSLGTPLKAITRHLFGLAAGRPGARRYRQWLSQAALPGESGAFPAGTAQGAAQADGTAAGLLRAAAVWCGA